MQLRIEIVNLDDLIQNKEENKIRNIFKFMFKLSEEMVTKKMEIERENFIDQVIIWIENGELNEGKIRQWADDFTNDLRSVCKNYYDKNCYEKIFNSYVALKRKKYKNQYENVDNPEIVTDRVIACCYGNEKLLGICSSSKTEKGYNIDKLYITSNARAQGIGSSLLDSMITYLKCDNEFDTPVGIQVLINNEIAQKLYKKVGFKHKKDEDDQDIIKNLCYYLEMPLGSYQKGKTLSLT